MTRRSLQHSTISLWANSQVLPGFVLSSGWGRWGLKRFHKWTFCLKTNICSVFSHGVLLQFWEIHSYSAIDPLINTEEQKSPILCVCVWKVVTEDTGVKLMIRPFAQFRCYMFLLYCWMQHGTCPVKVFLMYDRKTLRFWRRSTNKGRITTFICKCDNFRSGLDVVLFTCRTAVLTVQMWTLKQLHNMISKYENMLHLSSLGTLIPVVSETIGQISSIC